MLPDPRPLPRTRRPLLVRSAAGASAALLGLTALAACGSDDTNDAADEGMGVSASIVMTEEPTDSPSETSKAADVEIDVTLTGSKVSPAPGNVKIDEGDTVSLTVTRDSDGEIHVHGYELEADAKAGQPETFEFVADQTGVFEVEAHDPDVLLTRLQVS